MSQSEAVSLLNRIEYMYPHIISDYRYKDSTITLTFPQNRWLQVKGFFDNIKVHYSIELISIREDI